MWFFFTILWYFKHTTEKNNFSQGGPTLYIYIFVYIFNVKFCSFYIGTLSLLINIRKYMICIFYLYYSNWCSILFSLFLEAAYGLAGDHVETVPAAAGSSDSEPTVTRIDIEEDYIPDLGEKQAEGFLQDGEEKEEVDPGKRVYILVHKS